jgi:hypothetical protein
VTDLHRTSLEILGDRVNVPRCVIKNFFWLVYSLLQTPGMLCHFMVVFGCVHAPFKRLLKAFQSRIVDIEQRY